MKTLKKTIILCLLILIGIETNGQERSIPNYDFYVGTWVYETPTEQFILKTKKHDYNFYGERRYVVLGVFKYVKNGKVIYDFLNTLEGRTMKSGVGHVILRRAADLPNNETQPKLLIIYSDPKTINVAKAWASFLTILSTNPAKLSWHIEIESGDPYEEDSQGNFIDITDPELLNGLTIPTDMILRKVE